MKTVDHGGHGDHGENPRQDHSIVLFAVSAAFAVVKQRLQIRRLLPVEI
jgi:hypothetical protein